MLDFTSPANTTCPVVTKVSIATRASWSHARKLSIKASEIWSAILSGCPSDTDSEVNKYAIVAFYFCDVRRRKRIEVEVEKHFSSGFSTFLPWLQSPLAACPYAMRKSVHIFRMQKYYSFLIYNINLQF